MYKAFIFFLLTGYCGVVLAQPTAYIDKRPVAQLRMNAKDEGIVLRYGDGPDSCDILGAREAIINKENGIYYLFYDGAGKDGWLACLAESRDLITWEKKGAVLSLGDSGRNDAKSASSPWVVKEENFWHMFYLGTPNTTPAPERVPAFPYLTMKAKATSLNGPWEKQYDVSPFSTKPGTFYKTTASPGYVVKHKGKYIQIFSGSAQDSLDKSIVKRTLGIATTTNLDGEWQVDDRPILPLEEQIENSSLYFDEKSGFWFLFTNHIGIDQNDSVEYTDAIWVYWSKDIYKWNVLDKAIVLDSTNCNWSKGAIGMPTVIKHGEKLALLYDAFEGYSNWHMKRNIGLAWLQLPLVPPNDDKRNPEYVFKNPPESASPGVLWMWMGSNLSKKGITEDLEALKNKGFNKATMYNVSDIVTPWRREILNSPNNDLIAWTKPWWSYVRHAAAESKRLGIEFGMHNCPSYGTSGGVWITPERSMQELVWSVSDTLTSGSKIVLARKPAPDPRGKLLWPVYNPDSSEVESPVIPARSSYYEDIAVLAVPAEGNIALADIVNLTQRMDKTGKVDWSVPPGKWIMYRFGHTTMGALIQPAQWKATGLECDKMSEEAVGFHMDHIIGEIKQNIGDFIGNGFTHVLFDSYEAGTPTWTAKMPTAFKSRRGYDIIPYLPIFAGRIIESGQDTSRFRNDFDNTIKDLYRDVYFKTIRDKLHQAGLKFACEPYGGPWRQEEIVPMIDDVLTEFWTNKGFGNPYLGSTVSAVRNSGQSVIEAEAFTGLPDSSRWNETPYSIKAYGDAAFCAGINRLLLHRFVHQPWDEHYKPGAAMGLWGTHFDRTQTWWKYIHALTAYWKRCQALLQWGNFAIDAAGDFSVASQKGGVDLNYVHRKLDSVHVFFVANTAFADGEAVCLFRVAGLQPEWWDPVTGEINTVAEFEVDHDFTKITIPFSSSQSGFVVFRNQIIKNNGRSHLPKKKLLLTISDSWKVSFDRNWGGPSEKVIFPNLQDWTKHSNPGIRYYSGIAMYQINFDFAYQSFSQQKLVLDLGTVRHIASVKLNGVDLGIAWTAPWTLTIPKNLVKAKSNVLEIEIANVWANRLIGDEQEPPDMNWLPGHIWEGQFLERFPDWFIKGSPRPSSKRYCFTTWNYFSKESPLVSSGLLGPVRILAY